MPIQSHCPPPNPSSGCRRRPFVSYYGGRRRVARRLFSARVYVRVRRWWCGPTIQQDNTLESMSLKSRASRMLAFIHRSQVIWTSIDREGGKDPRALLTPPSVPTDAFVAVAVAIAGTCAARAGTAGAAERGHVLRRRRAGTRVCVMCLVRRRDRRAPSPFLSARFAYWLAC